MSDAKLPHGIRLETRNHVIKNMESGEVRYRVTARNSFPGGDKLDKTCRTVDDGVRILEQFRSQNWETKQARLAQLEVAPTARAAQPEVADTARLAQLKASPTASPVRVIWVIKT